jgi:hypothetical protein
VDQVKASTTARGRSDDPPTNEWLADWLDLVTVRDQAANQQDRATNPRNPPVPKADDDPITERMNQALPGCDVPLAITEDLAY